MDRIKFQGMKISSQIKTEMKKEPIGEYSLSYENDENLIPAEGRRLVELDSELQEEFHAVMERIKCEELMQIAEQTEPVDIKPAVFHEMYEVPISKQSFKFPKVISELNNDTPSPLLCRLCAKGNNAMVCMFGQNEVQRNIVEQIEYCFSITIKETDVLSKQACLSCIEKLEVCYQFHKTVARAEKKLFMIDKQTSRNLEDADKYCRLLPRCNEHDATTYADNEEKLKTFIVEDGNNDESTTNPEEPQVTDTTVEKNTVLLNVELCSKELFPKETYHENNPDEDNRTKSSSDEYQSEDFTTNALFSGETSAPQIELGTIYSAADIPKQVEQLVLDKELKLNETMSKSEFHLPSITRGRKAYNCARKKVRKDNGDDDIVFCAGFFNGQTLSEKKKEIISCHICRETFQTLKKLRKHTSIHYSTNYYPCCLCDETLVTEKDWTEHHLQHTEVEKFRKNPLTPTCNECGKKFSTKLLLEFHELEHKSSAKIHYCENCFEVMDSETSLQQHMVDAHKQHDKSSDEFREKELRTLDQLNQDHDRKRDSGFECTSCNRKFRSNYVLKVHREIHCMSLSTKKRNFSCFYCGKRFMQKASLIVHERRHTGERPYDCDFCAKTFTTKRSRDCHRRSHTGERPFKCSICEKTFAWPASLRLHLSVHSESKPYDCPVCPQSFKTSRTRNIHMNVHTDERPYTCNVCGSCFKRKDHVKTHKNNNTCLAKLATNKARFKMNQKISNDS